MINLTLASGRITNSDVVRVEYVKPDSNPPVILINWPPQPSVIEPNPKALAAIATSVVRIMAEAQAHSRGSGRTDSQRCNTNVM
jgi:hypothetical protein